MPKRFRVLAALGLGALFLVGAADGPAFAKDKPAAKSKGPGVIAKPIKLAPAGIAWGQSLDAIVKLYDKYFDKQMLPLFKKAEPGPEMDALNEELRIKKGILRRSRLDFKGQATGVDYTPLKGQYTYKNGESMASLTLRSGTKRYFFFFNDKLWKIYDEHELKKGGALGTSFPAAIKVISKRFGASPKKLAPDPKAGRPFEGVEWRDPDTVIHGLDRGDILAMVYADKNVYDNLQRYRTNKMVDEHKLSADVLAVTQPEKKPEESDKDKKKKKK